MRCFLIAYVGVYFCFILPEKFIDFLSVLVLPPIYLTVRQPFFDPLALG
jgi:hypothetical protein